MRTMGRVTRTLFRAGAVAWMLAPAALPAQAVEQQAYETSDGQVVPAQTVVVPAGRADVWRAFTTSEGVMSWAAPFARVDFGLGGIWESSYDPTARAGDPDNIRNRFLAYVPERVLALQAEAAPPGFPHPEILPELFSVVLFEAVDEGHTRVTMYGVGYRDTPAHHEILELFRQGNAWSLGMLHHRFAEGPVDWTAVQGGGGR